MCSLRAQYGTATVVDVASGLLFYREHALMEGSELAMVLAGCAMCVLGVVVGQCA